jgi:nitroreductase
VHSFTDFDEAHTVMTGASDALNNAPAILFVTIPKQTPDWAILDAGAFMQSLLLAATAKGLGSIPTYNSVRYPQVVRQVLGIPETERLWSGSSSATKARPRSMPFGPSARTSVMF